MKTIPKLQNGGSYLSLFADYNIVGSPQTQQTERRSSSRKQEDDSDKGRLTEKDLFSLLKDVDGLPNEMQALVQSIQNMYQYNTVLGGSFDTQGLANLYAQNLYALKRANFNKNEYDKAYKQAESKQGLNEFAVTASGNLLVQNSEGNFTEVGLQEYLDNQGEYQALTNSNLLWYRAHDPRFVNENQVIFDTVSNATSMVDIDKMIRERLSTLGTTEFQQSGYIAKQNNQILQGLEVLSGARAQNLANDQNLSLDGLYKSEQITKTQKEQAEAALLYIYQTLPNNARTLLALKSGNKENPTKGALDVIQNLITSRQSEFRSNNYTFQSDLNIDGSKKSSKSGGDTKYNQAARIVTGNGMAEDFYLIGKDGKTGIRINSEQHTATRKDGTAYGNSTMSDLQTSPLASSMDFSNVSIGGHMVNPNLMKYIKTDGILHVSDLPVTQDEQGNIKPDLTLLKRFDEIQGDLKKLDPKTQQTEINELLRSKNLPIMYDQNGRLVSTNYRKFVMINSEAIEQALLNPEALVFDNDWVQEYEDENKQKEVVQMLADLNKTELKKDPYLKDFDYNDWGMLEGSYHKVFKAIAFIPMNESLSNAMATEDLTASEILSLKNRDLEQKAKREMIRAGGL